MTIAEIRAALKNGNLPETRFSILQGIAERQATEPDDPVVQELVLRALERSSEFGPLEPVLWDLARSRGLYPYLEQESLDLRSQIAFEYHRPGPLGDRGVVFHAPQARVYRELMGGRSVVLSAPTSFGKSLIIDALLLSGNYNNVLLIVPTIALIDETRRRLMSLKSGHKVITHLGQSRDASNVYVLTQERAIEHADDLDLDLFVIDEFYKLAPSRGDDARAAILNKVFYRLAARGVQFYMLGPSIKSVAPELEKRFECVFLHEPYHTVVSELHYVAHEEEDRFARLVDLCADLTGPTIVYCQSPRRASEVATVLARAVERKGSERLGSATSWIAEHYHPDWHLVSAMASRIGVHHGRIPRALAQFVVRAFEDDELDFLVCTSTLIEGVNTKARNVVVFDDTISTTKFDYFTFNNIRGRSGRMFRHFVGHVYLFYEPPAEELPFIDIPAVTQSDDATDSILLDLEPEELSAGSQIRVRKYFEQEILPLEIIRQNSGLEPDIQLDIAEALADMDEEELQLTVGWSGMPTYEELEAICNLIWAHTNASQLGAGSVRSPKQLAYRINDLRGRRSIRSLVESDLDYWRRRNPEAAADDSVQSILDFLRLWANFHFPRLLQAVDRIQQHVMVKRGLDPGDLKPFASQVENWFMGASVTALEEYGLPTQVTQKLHLPAIALDDLDAAIGYLKGLNIADFDLTDFETDLLRDTLASLE